ncbi:MAG: keto-deoxy-phosphogluconate aldolase [Nitrosomonadales bacterium]|nr:keto-deoxy-phosphogluconate aldolase [Nitrosomonadales bacterium]|tara:strand:- start:561 stop:1178 length:618 start_codon:yes stop_codon:yes gene_type:complete
METIELVKYGPVIPVIVIDDADDAVPIAEALLSGGVKVLEITLRTDCALKAIEKIAHEVPEAIVGAGTLRSKSDATNAKLAGSQFAVSPGYTNEMGLICKDLELPFLPGVSTGSEVMKASQDGYSFLKLFPAVAVGGVDLLKGFSGPFVDIQFCPTGGITIKTAPDFLSLPNVPVCGGTWLTPKNLIKDKNWSEITKLAKEVSSL